MGPTTESYNPTYLNIPVTKLFYLLSFELVQHEDTGKKKI